MLHVGNRCLDHTEKLPPSPTDYVVRHILWLPAMAEHQQQTLSPPPLRSTLRLQTMRLVWIGRDHADLRGMEPYLPAAETTVFLTRTKAPVAPPTDSHHLAASWELSLPVQEDCREELAKKCPSMHSNSLIMPLCLTLVSLCLTSTSYYYIRGAASVYVSYERSDETGDDSDPTQMQYLLAKVLVVACSFGAIAGTSVVARRVSHCVASLKCPFISRSATANTAAASARRATGTVQTQSPPQQSPSVWAGSAGLTPSPGVSSLQFGRPDMTALIDAAVAEVEGTALPSCTSASINRGLFVCVCGPETLVQSCKTAVREAKRRHRGVAVGLHAEEPDW
eukprot:COSAG01_NODE_261_length_20040_cov_33.761496_6_plen_337_part_00